MPPIPIADTPVCNNSIQDIAPVLIVDTPAYNNNNTNFQDIPSPLSDTVSPQQTSVTRGKKPKVMEPNYRNPYNHWHNAECLKYREGQAKPEELNMTKLVDNGEILTLDNESMSNEPLSKKPDSL